MSKSSKTKQQKQNSASKKQGHSQSKISRSSESTDFARLQDVVDMPNNATASEILQLQRLYGNAAVTKLIRSRSQNNSNKVGQTGNFRQARYSPTHRVRSSTLQTPLTIQRTPASGSPTSLADGLYQDRKIMTTAAGVQVPSRITYIMKNPAKGSKPSVDPPGWSWLQFKLGKVKGQWVRFHIINENLGGPGNQKWNLVPTTVAMNNDYERNFEHDAKISAKTKWTYVDVTLTYDPYWLQPIPSRIDAEWGNWNSSTGSWKSQGTWWGYNGDVPAIEAGRSAYLRGVQITRRHLTKRGVPARYRAAFLQWLKTYRQGSDSDWTFLFALEAAFPHSDESWIEQVWLDEVGTTGSYQPVVKSIR